jgi:hypothetical protein
VYCRWNLYTEPLPINERRDEHRDTQTDGRRFMKYGVETGSVVMTYIPSFIKVGSGIRKLKGVEGKQTQTEW